MCVYICLNLSKYVHSCAFLPRHDCNRSTQYFHINKYSLTNYFMYLIYNSIYLSIYLSDILYVS